MRKKDLYLEQIILGEISHTNNEFEIKEKEEINAIKKENKAILEKYPAYDMEFAVRSKMLSSNEEKLHGREKKFRPNETKAFFTSQRIMAIAAMLCLAFLLPIGIQLKNRTETQGQNRVFIEPKGSERAKGFGGKIFVYKKEGSSAVRLANLSKVSEGDVLQVSYVSSGFSYGYIFSVDGNGHCTQHFPEKGKEPGLLTGKGEIALDYAYKLDNAPSFERFFFISSKDSFSRKNLDAFFNQIDLNARDSIDNLASYLPSALEVHDVFLVK